MERSIHWQGAITPSKTPSYALHASATRSTFTLKTTKSLYMLIRRVPAASPHGDTSVNIDNFT